MKCQTCGKTIDGWCLVKKNKGWCYTCYTTTKHDDDDGDNETFEEEEEEETFLLEHPNFQKLKIDYIGGLN